MKTFKQFLLEESQDVFELIKKDCQPFLKIWNKTLLMRGSRSMPEENLYSNPEDGIKFKYDKRQVRTDRKASATPEEVMSYQDEWFEEKFGVKARSSSLFCYSEIVKNRLGMYGYPYLIFPIGEFQIIWAPDISDLYGRSYEPGYSYTEEQAKELNIILLNKSNYLNDDPSGALESGAELMLVCKEYYALPLYDMSNNDIDTYAKEKLS